MELLLDVLLIRVNSQIKLYFKNANAHFSRLCVLFFHTIPFDFHMIHTRSSCYLSTSRLLERKSCVSLQCN